MDKNNTLIKRLLNLKEDYTLDLNEGEDKDTLKVLPEKEVVEKDSPQEILLAKLMAQFINGELSADEFVQKEKEVKSMASLEEDDVDTERDPDEGDDNETSNYTDGEEGEDSKETPKERVKAQRMPSALRKELEDIECRMPKIEQEISLIDNELKGISTDYIKLMELNEKKDELSKEYDTIMERYFELLEIKEQYKV